MFIFFNTYLLLYYLDDLNVLLKFWQKLWEEKHLGKVMFRLIRVLKEKNISHSPVTRLQKCNKTYIVYIKQYIYKCIKILDK